MNGSIGRQGEATYTVRSIAWPNLDPHDHTTDDIHVTFDERPFGSGVSFEFLDYGIKVSGFDDGYRHLLDPRIQTVLLMLDAKHAEHEANGVTGNAPSATVDELREMLESQGILPDPEYMFRNDYAGRRVPR